ncbi:MAG: hypothetical protein IT426_03370 [Pirellulales bacterium]|nr:hypothetical protein [Pirellulales bacterium]
MNHFERFRAVCRGESVDYVPILGLPGASGAAFGGAWGEIYRRLLDTGMPPSVIGWTEENAALPDASRPWSKYWGTLSPITLPFWACDRRGEIKHRKTVRDGFEILEYETGAVTRQIVGNDDAYSMPSFERHHVRDRESWQRCKACLTPSPPWTRERIVAACEPYRRRERPLYVDLGGTWGAVRDLMGPERACTVLHDDPALACEMLDWLHEMRKAYLFPLVEYLRPEIVALHEDCCYNHGMMIGPRCFVEMCGTAYREIAELRTGVGVEMFAVDSDGNVGQLIPCLEALGANALYPLEAKANQTVAAFAAAHPRFVLLGGLEKEVVNAGNESAIDKEIGRIEPLLRRGRFFPNLDHTLQPFCTFDNFRRFMTALHDALNNPEGTFPRLE